MWHPLIDDLVRCVSWYKPSLTARDSGKRVRWSTVIQMRGIHVFMPWVVLQQAFGFAAKVDEQTSGTMQGLLWLSVFDDPF